MSEPTLSAKAPRLVSLDAYRGFIMLAMVSGGFGFPAVVRRLPDSPAWKFLAHEFDHVPWIGCAFWDLIQPSFIFMVGVAMPYSFASRRDRGDSYGRIFAHTLLRSAVLVFLGVFLASAWSTQTNFVFTNVLAQIGLGYTLVFLLLNRGWRVQSVALAAILVGYWLYFFLYPLPGPDFDYRAFGLKEDWPLLTGLLAHWNKNVNAAAFFDRWFLNVFPRAEPYLFNEGGYQTLSFVPSAATMLIGLMAGEFLRGPQSPAAKCRRLFLTGVIALIAGAALGETLCPIVKRIWTPSWTVFSAGCTLVMLAAFYWLIDLRGRQRWAFPLVVVGMNSIAIYCMSQLLKPWVRGTLRIHFGKHVFEGTYFGHELFTPVYAPIAESVATMAVLWLICYWMYRQKIFVRI